MLRRAGAFHFSVQLGWLSQREPAVCTTPPPDPYGTPSEHSRGKCEHHSCSYVQFGQKFSIYRQYQ